MSQFPPTSPSPMPPGGMVKPHRGAVVLVLGILGLLLCFILGIVAWVMGTGDLHEMAEGRMDPSGRGLTQAGKILGIIATCLGILGVLWVILSFVILGGAIAAGAASGGTGP